MNILLTGSNGFLGSYFINEYSEKYKINRFSFLNDNIKDLELINIDILSLI